MLADPRIQCHPVLARNSFDSRKPETGAMF